MVHVGAFTCCLRFGSVRCWYQMRGSRALFRFDPVQPLDAFCDTLATIATVCWMRADLLIALSTKIIGPGRLRRACRPRRPIDVRQRLGIVLCRCEVPICARGSGDSSTRSWRAYSLLPGAEARCRRPFLNRPRSWSAVSAGRYGGMPSAISPAALDTGISVPLAKPGARFWVNRPIGSLAPGRRYGGYLAVFSYREGDRIHQFYQQAGRWAKRHM